MNNYKRFKYKLTLNEGEFYVFGESIPNESQNVKPISFEIIYKNYTDEQYSTGKQVFTTISSI
jgi:hypothetical protein